MTAHFSELICVKTLFSSLLYYVKKLSLIINVLEICQRLKSEHLSRWKRHIVVNSMQARLRAQLGDRSKYSGERRRRSVVVASIVLTITDPLRGSYPFWYYLQAALIRSCGASFACMELTIISRFQRLQASTKSLLHSLFL